MSELKWVGPFGVGFSQKMSDYAQRYGPHVYVYLLSYPKVQTVVAYAGKAVNLQRRTFGGGGHFSSFAGLCYVLRDENAEIQYNPSTDFEKALGEFDYFFHLAKVELERLQFFVAPCEIESLTSVEGVLIQKLVSSTYPGLRRDNSWVPSGQSDIPVSHDFSQIEASSQLERILTSN